MLFAHGALFLLRTPLGSILHLSPNNDFAKSAWLELLSMEALLFTISISFILLAMAKERLEYSHRAAAQTDPLTGIANRRGFLELSALKRMAAEQRDAAVMLFDLDRFKLINDRFGHPIGDRALQLFADSARIAIGSRGLVGRWGGDEFAAVVFGATDLEAEALAERIRSAYEQAAADIDGRPAHATVSIGMVFSDDGPLDLPELMARADKTLYRAKERGRNRVEVSHEGVRRDADRVVTSLEEHRRKAASAA
jgi:diguanylate cyclase (GGDEF)-like protein